MVSSTEGKQYFLLLKVTSQFTIQTLKTELKQPIWKNSYWAYTVYTHVKVAVLRGKDVHPEPSHPAEEGKLIGPGRAHCSSLLPHVSGFPSIGSGNVERTIRTQVSSKHAVQPGSNLIPTGIRSTRRTTE